MYARFVQLYPSNEQAADVRLELAKMQEAAGETRAAVVSYKALANASNRDDALLGSAKAAVLTLKLGQDLDGRRLLAQVMQQLRAKDAPAAFEARRVVAEALFNESEALFASIKQMPVRSAQNLQADIARKQRNLEIIAKRYQDVMNLENAEYVVASLYRLGELHEDLAQKLFAVTSPEGASQVDDSKFKTSIEKLLSLARGSLQIL